MEEWLAAIVAEHANAIVAAIEVACEKALQAGDRGVSVYTWDPDPDGSCGAAGPDPAVPYGYIHRHPHGRRPSH